MGVHGFTADYRLGSCFSVFSFVWEYMGSPPVIRRIRVSQSLVLWTIVSLFLVFHLTVVLSVFLKCTDSGYPLF